MDTQADYFVTSDTESCIHVFSYSSRNPKIVIHYSEVESICNFKSGIHERRGIRKICFDSTSNKHIFAFMSLEVCFVYDIDTRSPISYITYTDNLSSTSSKTCGFRSFAFCGEGCMYILRDTEIIKWNYLSSSINKVQCLNTKLDRSCRSICLSGDNTILEVLTTNALILYSISKQDQEGIHDTTKTETLTCISQLHMSINGIDSFIDRVHQRVMISK